MVVKDRTLRIADYTIACRVLEAAAPQAARPATLWWRAGAIFLDWLTFTLITFVIGIVGRLIGIRSTQAIAFGQMSGLLIYFVIFLIGIGRWGLTPGKWILQLRVVRPGSSRVGLMRSFFRVLVLLPNQVVALFFTVFILLGLANTERTQQLGLLPLLAAGVAMLGMLGWAISIILISVTVKRRGVHDHVAGTQVMRVPLPRGHVKRMLKLGMLPLSILVRRLGWNRSVRSRNAAGDPEALEQTRTFHN